MSPADLIRQTREEALLNLTAAYDYYVDTKFAWSVVEDDVTNGLRFSNVNLTTGTNTTDGELVRKSHGYIRRELAEATFQQFLAIFEHFLLDVLRIWLTVYPRSLGKKTIDFRAVLDAPDKEAIIELMIRKELNEVSYDRPAGWSPTWKKRRGWVAPRPTRSTSSPRPRPPATFWRTTEGSSMRPTDSKPVGWPASTLVIGSRSPSAIIAPPGS